MPIHSFRGGAALSAFRIEKLFPRLRAIAPGLVALDSRYVHLVRGQVHAGEQAVLERLLTYGPPASDAQPTGVLLFVIPRFGTISPWASKATDIAHNCGLAGVRRIERGAAFYLEFDRPPADAVLKALAAELHDPMTETVVSDINAAARLFETPEPKPLVTVDLVEGGAESLALANDELGLALSADEIDYLVDVFNARSRNPTDAELMMFAQANSEHCRHKIFNGRWIIDGAERDETLFDMIRATHAASPDGVLSAYSDNASVVAGHPGERFLPGPDGGYGYVAEDVHLLMKVETHNHPTAIAPHPGAATGAGGEIRDEGATGRGAKPKAGLAGFSVSNLRIPDFPQPWEADHGKPARMASALDIMLAGPIGAASFNNEFGRPNLAGYFRTFEQRVGESIRGYHKPIMLAGGMGAIRPAHVAKQTIPAGGKVIVIGGPAMLIGLGGGAASSLAGGEADEAIDFASVQRGNPEMQRRAQELIDRCLERGETNPIQSVHDVGAGGLANAVPELLEASGRGGRIALRAIPADDEGLSPMELWCNESQERYVLAVAPERVDAFAALAERERCPYAVLGEATDDAALVVADDLFDNRPVDMAMDALFGKPPKMLRDVSHREPSRDAFAIGTIDDFKEAALDVLRHPSVADKGFLITIGDRTVGGLSHRDQMVGPWQVPVADVAVTLTDFNGYAGEAMAIGERAPVALLDAPASGRMAVAEALTNIAAAPVAALADVRLSANWMAAAGHAGEDAALFDTVKAVSEMCVELGVAIPVGKDSLSMAAGWREGETTREVISPVSLVVSAFAPLADVRPSLTPQLRLDDGASELILIDLGRGQNRLGGSILAQTRSCLGGEAPDCDNPALLRHFLATIQELTAADKLLAYHDRSDGGLFACAAEMAFAAHCGVDIDCGDASALFSEELGAIVQVRSADKAAVVDRLRAAGLNGCVFEIGTPREDDQCVINAGGRELFRAARVELQRAWAGTSYHMQSLRDDPVCAREELSAKLAEGDPGLHARLTYDINEDTAAPFVGRGARPRVAVLREEGVNGQVEMAAAFDRAGFAAADVHMSDILEGRTSLADFEGIAACGGFSYGDVLGAGGGWAKSILFNSRARDEFEAFFTRADTFGFGACNGCQMMSALRELIPGTAHWPHFIRNRSEQYEARLSLVEVLDSPSLFFSGMAGSVMPIVVAHGEGRADFDLGGDRTRLETDQLVALRYVDHHERVAETYPANPNGSPGAITGVTTPDGRFTVTMPHPERAFRVAQYSWRPDDWREDGPWIRMFRNAREWIG
jgi:phosphoribosylformylglycinamidine synthase